MALSNDVIRDYRHTGPDDRSTLPVKGSSTIYEGAACSLASGVAHPLSASDTSDGFCGFAVKKADNGSGSDSAINVDLRQRGYVKLSVTGVSAVTHVTDAVYATDDGTFTLTSSGGLQIGKVDQWITGAYAWVYFEATKVRSI